MTIVPMDASQASQGFELGSTRYIGQHGDQTASTEADMWPNGLHRGPRSEASCFALNAFLISKILILIQL